MSKAFGSMNCQREECCNLQFVNTNTVPKLNTYFKIRGAVKVCVQGKGIFVLGKKMEAIVRKKVVEKRKDKRLRLCLK